MAKVKLSSIKSSDNQSCSVPDCSNKFYAKTYCKLHYQRIRRNGKPDNPFQDICSLNSCEKPHYGHGFCRKHYDKNRRKDLIGKKEYKCTVDGCDYLRASTNYCITHYKRWKKFGSPLSNGKPTTEIRFWSKVNKNTENGCWEWTGLLNDAGYGRFSFKGKPLRAHRVSWFLTFGEFPKLLLLHSCDNPLCVNPAHLREGSNKDNMDDKISKGRNGRKLNQEKVKEIRKMLVEKIRTSEIAVKFNVSVSVIRSIRSNRIWKNI